MVRIRLLGGTFLAITLIATIPSLAEDQPSSVSKSAPSAKQGMGDAKKPGTSAANMQQMMARCAEMREQMKQGKPMSADMHAMMQQCDQMDNQMGMPSGTKSR